MWKTTTQFSVQQLVRATNRETTNARITDSLQGESSSDPQKVSTLWRHQMETFSALVALCAGNSPVPVNSPHKGQWRGALMFSLICAWTNGCVNNREAGDLRRHRAHCDVIVMNSETVSMSWRHGYTYWVHVAYNKVWCGQWSRSLYIPFQHLRLRPSRLHLVEISDPPINVVSSETRCILLQRRHCLHTTHMRCVLPPLCHPWKKYHIRLWLLGDLSEMLWINSFFIYLVKSSNGLLCIFTPWKIVKFEEKNESFFLVTATQHSSNTLLTMNRCINIFCVQGDIECCLWCLEVII